MTKHQMRLRPIAAVGAVVGAVLYSNWLLEIPFTRKLPDPDIFASELAAADQPYAAWFQWGDRASAVVLLVAAVAALGALSGVRRGWCSRLGWSLVGVLAVSTALDSTVWGLVCAPHSSAACEARELAGAVPMGHQLHLLSSVIAVTAAALSFVAFVVADLVERTTPAPVRHFGRLMVVALIGSSIWTAVADAIDERGGSGPIGISQRAELAAMACCLIYVALRTACAHARSKPSVTAPSAPAVAGHPSTRPPAAAWLSPASAHLRRPASHPARSRFRPLNSTKAPAAHHSFRKLQARRRRLSSPNTRSGGPK
jgi:hypothetical protein